MKLMDEIAREGVADDWSAALSVPEIKTAVMNLGDFITATAADTVAEIGCTYRPATTAPSTYNDLVREFRLAQTIGLPVRVSNEFSDDTIYDAPATNFAARFVHDSRHVWFQCDFTLSGELFVNRRQLAALKRAGFGPESLEHRLYLSDTIGQTLFVAACGSFPRSQTRFALRCVDTPKIIDAVYAEIDHERHGSTR